MILPHMPGEIALWIRMSGDFDRPGWYVRLCGGGGSGWGTLGRPAADRPGGDRALLLRIRAFIDRHLADPDLTPRAIARAHSISLRHLHNLFESEDATVSRWIQRRRLEECRRDLARHAKGSTIAAVAHRWGFVSAAHFSRVFRAVYGMAPRECRDSRPTGAGTCR